MAVRQDKTTSVPVTRPNPAAEIQEWLKDPAFAAKAKRAQKAARDALHRVTRIPEEGPPHEPDD